MFGETVMLQIVNLLFSIMPLTRWYRLRARLLCFAGVDCSDSARIISSARIVIKNVSIGKDSFIGEQVLITGDRKCKITIGDNIDIGPRVLIVSGAHEIDMFSAHSAGAGKGAEVCIEDGVWIGANATILPGVKIGRKAVIGAGSLVNRDIPPFCVAVGNPCLPIKKWNFEQNCFERIEK